ncbi:MAG TPA: LOG family protein [Candidatus Omnitrophota bacterium]|nr:LOG family protein [Candidatus Omnitrophota bacterium]HPS37614.1 LOG family protein [Candidatus Omnitrophota bacterium]
MENLHVDKHGGNTGDPKLDQLVHQLIHDAGQGEQADLVEEMIGTALRIYREGLDRGDMKILNTALKELRLGLRVFEKYRAFRKVALFGSARTPRSDPNYQIAMKFSKEIVRKGWMVITGAASGIMEAGNVGAGPKNSFGMNIRLPFEQEANLVMLKDPKLVTFKYFFTRKLMFLRESHATVLCPGGFGTHDEGFETLTLVQTGKTDPRPIVCLDAPGSEYWKHFRIFLKKQLADEHLIHEDDIDFMHFTQNVEDAVKYTVDFYKMYHSMRYIRDMLVMRIEKPLSDAQLDYLNQQFKGIVKKGKIIQSLKPFDEEKNAPYTFHLTRLAFSFKMNCYTQIHRMIHVLNSFA